MDPQLCKEFQIARFASSKQQWSRPSQRQISADSLYSRESSRKKAVMSKFTDRTSVDPTCDSENQDSIRSLPTSPVNDVEIPQNHQQSTISNRLIVVNSAGEGPVDEQTLADKYQPYENNFTPVNPPETSVSTNAAAQLKECPDKAVTTVHAPRSPHLLKFFTEIHSLCKFSKASRKTRVSGKFRIGKKNPRHSLSSPSDMPISKRFRRVDTRQNSPEPLFISEESSHQVVPFTRSDTPCPVAHAHPKSLTSNLPVYNGLVEVIPYLSPPSPIDINNICYKAPKDPSLIPVVSLPQQSSAPEPRARKRTTCGNCGEAGHNLRTCPENYCSYCAGDGHKLRDCALAKEEAKSIKQQKAVAAGGRPWHKVDGFTPSLALDEGVVLIQNSGERWTSRSWGHRSFEKQRPRWWQVFGFTERVFLILDVIYKWYDLPGNNWRSFAQAA